MIYPTHAFPRLLDVAKKQGSTYRFMCCTLKFIYSCSWGSFWVDTVQPKSVSINWSLPTRTNRSEIHAIHAPKLWENGVVAKLQAHLVVTRLEVMWFGAEVPSDSGCETTPWWVGGLGFEEVSEVKHINLLKLFWLMIGVLHLRPVPGILTQQTLRNEGRGDTTANLWRQCKIRLTVGKMGMKIDRLNNDWTLLKHRQQNSNHLQKEERSNVMKASKKRWVMCYWTCRSSRGPGEIEPQ